MSKSRYITSEIFFSFQICFVFVIPFSSASTAELYLHGELALPLLLRLSLEFIKRHLILVTVVVWDKMLRCVRDEEECEDFCRFSGGAVAGGSESVRGRFDGDPPTMEMTENPSINPSSNRHIHRDPHLGIAAVRDR